MRLSERGGGEPGWLSSVHTYPVKGCYRVDHERASVEPWGLAGDRRWLIVDPDTGRRLTQREIPALTQIRPAPVEGGLVLRTADLPDLAVAEPAGAEPMDVTVGRYTGPAPRAGTTADDWLSEVLNRKVVLVWLDDPTRRAVNPEYGRPGDVVSFADGYPVLLANMASLDALNDWLVEAGSPEWPLPMTRFRPNLVVQGAPAWAEDGWIGRTVWVGSTAFRAVKPCDRCVVTTTDQDTGERGHEPLRTLARHRNFAMLASETSRPVDRGLLFAINLIPDSTGTVTIGDAVRVE